MDKNGGALAVLPYDSVIAHDDPAASMLAFLNSLYAAASEKAGWPVADLQHQHL